MSDSWSLKDKSSCVKLFEYDWGSSVYLKSDIDLLRQKLIEDIKSDMYENPVSDTDAWWNLAYENCIKFINKRFGVID